jgi:outer membrane protein assembly factor BamB
LFVCTSNGVDDTHVKIPAPDAPSFIALDQQTGRLLWKDNSPGLNILHSQWASPSYGVFAGQGQVIFAGGDGWVYSFDPVGDGHGGAKLLWKFDANPKTSKYTLGGRSTRNEIIAFPAIYNGLVYIVTGQDPEHGEGEGNLWCIDPAKHMDGSDVSLDLAVDRDAKLLPVRRLQAVLPENGEHAIPNPKSAVVWNYSKQDQNGDGRIAFEEQFHRSLSIPVIKDGILYIADFSGLFHCLNAKTGKVYWTYDLFAACWSSALLVDGKIFISDEDGDVTIFRHSTLPRVALTAVENRDGRTEFVPSSARWNPDLINELNMGTSVYMTPVVANNVLFIATRDMLYAIAKGNSEPLSRSEK